MKKVLKKQIEGPVKGRVAMGIVAMVPVFVAMGHFPGFSGPDMVFTNVGTLLFESVLVMGAFVAGFAKIGD